MPEQLALVDVAPAGPKLTDRQAWALEQLTTAGHEGLHTDELGALWHEHTGKHAAGDRCVWCGKTGLELARALSRYGLARYRSRLKIWQATQLPDHENEPAPVEQPEGPWTGEGSVPYGVIPF